MNRPFVFGLVFVSVACALEAQTVSVSAPELVSLPAYTADRPPTVLSRAPIAYPQIWLTDHRPHWVTVGLVLSPGGTIGYADLDTELASRPKIQAALLEQLGRWKFNPATLKGTPVASACYLSLVFNPAPVKTDAAEAPVRIVGTLLAPPLSLPSGNCENFHYAAKIKVKADGTGELLDLASFALPATDSPEQRKEPERSDVVKAVASTLRQWRFAPARHRGQAVEEEIPLEFWTVNDRRIDLVLPRAIGPLEVETPYVMRTTANIGRVLVAFRVTTSGTPERIRVLASSHSAYERSAIAGILRWHFQPGTAGGRPVPVEIGVPVTYRLRSGGIANVGLYTRMVGGNTYLVDSDPPRDRMGKILYDQPAQPILAVTPVFPFKAWQSSQTGDATVRMDILPDGSVPRVVVLKASSPEFGRAAEAAAYNWKFQAATLHEQPVSSALAHEFHFNFADRDFTPEPSEDTIRKFLGARSGEIVPEKDLDAVPRALYQPDPVTPVGSPAGTVLVEFYVDRGGVARLPHVISSPSDQLTYPALTAVARWQFSLPRQHGSAAIAVLRRPIVFGHVDP